MVYLSRGHTASSQHRAGWKPLPMSVSAADNRKSIAFSERGSATIAVSRLKAQKPLPESARHLDFALFEVARSPPVDHSK